MSKETWKLEKDLCRCCHSEGSFKNLSEPACEGQEEVLTDMLQFTLDINMSPVAGLLCFVTYTICEACLERLKDATNFKRQVLQCEERFRDMYDRDVIKVLTVGDFCVKEEVTELDQDVEDVKTDEPHIDTEDNNDFANYDDDMKSETEVREDTGKRTKKTKQKNKTKKKLGRPKKRESIEVTGDGEKKDTFVPPEDMTDYTVVEEGNRRKYSCNKCGTLLSTLDSMRMHIVAGHFNIMTFECPLCDAKFKHKGTKTQHLAKKHGKEEIKVGNSKVIREAQKCICEICKKEFPSRSCLTRHIPTHKLFNCPECSVVFSKEEIAIHRADAHGVTIPTCGVCGYKNSKEWRVITHQRKVHLKEKNLSCSHCDATFFDIHQLRKHLVRHNPLRIFECSFCRKKFPRLNTLRQHEKIHTGDKRKVCSICNERFVQKASLNYHMAKHHPEAC